MDQSRKQFKALNMAQPIKKQINETLIKLQTQKRKYLSLQREQVALKDELQKARRQLNEVKLLEPKTRVKENKNIQTTMSINNTDRLYLNTVNKISQLRTKIDVHRKQIDKYKRLVNITTSEIHQIESQNNSLENHLLKQQDKNETIKTHLMDYRTLNMRNTDEFKNSFHALHRSSIKEENQRKKSSALRRNFNNEELKNSNIIRLVDKEEGHSSSLTLGQHPKTDLYMTNCIPLVKQRIRSLIHSNKEKIRISQNYKKFGQDLENMFAVMKEYKGRDDVAFIADEFVMKEKQLKKIQQYIGKLENRLMAYRAELQKIRHADHKLVEELQSSQNQEGKVKEKHFVELQHQIELSITQLKEQQHKNTDWFNKIGGMLGQLVNEDTINRGNINKFLAVIEEIYFTEERPIVQVKEEKVSKSPSKQTLVPTIEEKEIKAVQSVELMSYQKLKEYAKEYVQRKK